MDKKVTSRDVAKAAGVSQSLVSLVLNDVRDRKIKGETREHVLAVAKQLNYTVNIAARNMKIRRAGAIGLLSAWDAGSFVFAPIVKGVQEVCSESDTGVVICTGREDSLGSRDYIDYYRQRRIDALIYISYVGVPYEGVISDLTDHGIPFVCIIGARDIPGVSCVDVSFLESGHAGGKHLAEMGYGCSAYIFPGGEHRWRYAEKERYEGCRAAISEAGKRITVVDPFDGVSDQDAMIERAEGFLRAGGYDSVVSTSYFCFIVLKAAARLGIRIPEQLGVVSLDNEAYAPYLYPSLTTVDEPLFDIARNATAMLFGNMKGRDECRKLEMPPRLTVRESTKR